LWLYNLKISLIYIIYIYIYIWLDKSITKESRQLGFEQGEMFLELITISK
jgi:hypothetical protein